MGIRTNTTVEVTPDHTTLQHQHDWRQARSKEGRQAQGPRRPPQVLCHDRRCHRRAEGQDWLLPPGYPEVCLRQLQGGRRQGRTAPPHGPEGWHQEGIPEDGQGVRQGSWQVQAGQGEKPKKKAAPKKKPAAKKAKKPAAKKAAKKPAAKKAAKKPAAKKPKAAKKPAAKKPAAKKAAKPAK